MTTWRERFAPLIKRAIDDARAAGGDDAAVKAALRAAYPCQRMGWAYKCWLDECARQRGVKAGRVRRAKGVTIAAEAVEQAGQQCLFLGAT